MPWLKVEYNCGNCVIGQKYFSTRYGSKGKITYTHTEDGKTTTAQKRCNDRKSELHGNTQLVVDGIKRDSLAESNRFEELMFLQKNGYIKDLQYQVSFELIPRQQGENRNERPIKYIADFAYDEKQPDGSWKHIVEDKKGHKTKDYIIKRKLMLYIHGISIMET